MNRIRDAAGKRGAVTMQAMADLFGCSRQYLYQLFDGTCLPSLELAHRMADALSMSVADLTEPT